MRQLNWWTAWKVHCYQILHDEASYDRNRNIIFARIFVSGIRGFSERKDQKSKEQDSRLSRVPLGII
jgi:hypothetical protein